MTCFVNCEDAADLVTNEIPIGPFDSFPIDRHAAQQLIVAGRGDPSKSIISQMTLSFRKVGLSHLQCKKRPWKVKFAGGPTRELMTEAAASIFEPTSHLDDGLREHFRHLQDVIEVEGWDEVVHPLPGHSPEMFVRASDVEFYIFMNACN
jgi:hypothetical protein